MSVTITAADINKLRQATGAGMLDCRKALTESNGDFEAAIDWLRKQGQKVAAKRSDREAKAARFENKADGGDDSNKRGGGGRGPGGPGSGQPKRRVAGPGQGGRRPATGGGAR